MSVFHYCLFSGDKLRCHQVRKQIMDWDEFKTRAKPKEAAKQQTCVAGDMAEGKMVRVKNLPKRKAPTKNFLF